MPIHKLLAEVEELKSQQEAIRSVPPDLVAEADWVDFKTVMMPKLELKNPWERVRQGACGLISIAQRNSQICLVKMYVPSLTHEEADEKEGTS